MKRPASFTFLAVLFAWLTIAGLMFAWTAPLANADQMTALHLQPGILVLLGLADGVLAAMVSVGLWRAAWWVTRAILVWGLSLVISFVALQTMIGIAGEPWWLVALPHLVFVALVLALYRFTRRRGQAIQATI